MQTLPQQNQRPKTLRSRTSLDSRTTILAGTIFPGRGGCIIIYMCIMFVHTAVQQYAQRGSRKARDQSLFLRAPFLEILKTSHHVLRTSLTHTYIWYIRETPPTAISVLRCFRSVRSTRKKKKKHPLVRLLNDVVGGSAFSSAPAFRALRFDYVCRYMIVFFEEQEGGPLVFFNHVMFRLASLPLACCVWFDAKNRPALFTQYGQLPLSARIYQVQRPFHPFGRLFFFYLSGLMIKH